MNIKDFIEGVKILQPYWIKPDGYHLGAAHDIIYLYATDRPVEATDVASLCALGFFQDGCNFEGPDDYQPDEAWAAFT